MLIHTHSLEHLYTHAHTQVHIPTRTRTVSPNVSYMLLLRQVRTESGVIVNDWLWTDERSHVNILVHLKNENKYLVFKQKKYGLEREYYALIGGLFNNGETGLQCAKRELLEETGLEAEELIDLGNRLLQTPWYMKT